MNTTTTSTVYVFRSYRNGNDDCHLILNASEAVNKADMEWSHLVPSERKEAICHYVEEWILPIELPTSLFTASLTETYANIEEWMEEHHPDIDFANLGIEAFKDAKATMIKDWKEA